MDAAAQALKMYDSLQEFEVGDWVLDARGPGVIEGIRKYRLGLTDIVGFLVQPRRDAMWCWTSHREPVWVAPRKLVRYLPFSNL